MIEDPYVNGSILGAGIPLLKRAFSFALFFYQCPQQIGMEVWDVCFSDH
jgi:hypothetical protein